MRDHPPSTTMLWAQWCKVYDELNLCNYMKYKTQPCLVTGSGNLLKSLLSSQFKRGMFCLCPKVGRTDRFDVLAKNMNGSPCFIPMCQVERNEVMLTWVVVLFLTCRKKLFCKICWSVVFVCLFVTRFLATVFKQSFWNFLYVGDRPRTETLHFEDPNPDPDLRIFKVIRHHWEIGSKTMYSTIQYLKKLWMDSD